MPDVPNDTTELNMLLTVRKPSFREFGTRPEDGLTLRDYFAMEALGGILADPEATGNADELADISYNYADAMLRRRMR
jgi:hypothetical protein